MGDNIYALPEFDVDERDDGVLVARHRASGETVTARTWENLTIKAAAKRIIWSLRSGGAR